MHIDDKNGILYAVTKNGFLFLYEISSASLIHK